MLGLEKKLPGLEVGLGSHTKDDRLCIKDDLLRVKGNLLCVKNLGLIIVQSFVHRISALQQSFAIPGNLVLWLQPVHVITKLDKSLSDRTRLRVLNQVIQFCSCIRYFILIICSIQELL